VPLNASSLSNRGPIQSIIAFTPRDILWHYALGYMPDFLDGNSGAVGWVRWPHRGVQFLDKFKIPRKQKPYVLAPEFELRIDTAFEEVVRACADVRRPAIADGPAGGQTWITPALINGLLKLHAMGYAHSYEAWVDNKLAGGTFGVQLGGLITMVSLFHRLPNASKAAAGRAMMHLRDRGFGLIDIGMVPTHHVDFGAEWVPRWQYEKMLPALVRERRSIAEDRPCPRLPAAIRLGVPVVRAYRAMRRRLPGGEG
jgi:leucyl/phenylalanyl-tRNA--protein transferase